MRDCKKTVNKTVLMSVDVLQNIVLTKVFMIESGSELLKSEL